MIYTFQCCQSITSVFWMFAAVSETFGEMVKNIVTTRVNFIYESTMFNNQIHWVNSGPAPMLQLSRPQRRLQRAAGAAGHLRQGAALHEALRGGLADLRSAAPPGVPGRKPYRINGDPWPGAEVLGGKHHGAEKGGDDLMHYYINIIYIAIFAWVLWILKGSYGFVEVDMLDIETTDGHSLSFECAKQGRLYLFHAKGWRTKKSDEAAVNFVEPFQDIHFDQDTCNELKGRWKERLVTRSARSSCQQPMISRLFTSIKYQYKNVC